MTAEGKVIMERWRLEEKQVIIYSQSGEKKRGRIIDYDDTEIVLENNGEYPIKKIVCRNWFYVEEASPGSCHD